MRAKSHPSTRRRRTVPLWIKIGGLAAVAVMVGWLVTVALAEAGVVA